MNPEKRNSLSLGVFFQMMEGGLKGSESLSTEYQEFHSLQRTAICMVIREVKKMLKPEAFDSVQLSDEQQDVLSGSFLEAVEIEQAGFGLFRLNGIRAATILAIASYLNGMTPQKPAEAQQSLQLDLWPQIECAITSKRMEG